MAASALARPGFAPLGVTSPPERADRSVSVVPGLGLVGTRGSVDRRCPVGSVPAVPAAGLVDLRPGRLGGRRLRRLEPQFGLRRCPGRQNRRWRGRLVDVCQDPLDDRRIENEGDDPHGLAAARAQERQALADPRQQQRPAAGGKTAGGAALFAVIVGRARAGTVVFRVGQPHLPVRLLDHLQRCSRGAGG